MQPNTRGALMREANHCLREGARERALHVLIALVRSAPHDFDARLRLADGLLAAGQVRAAVEAYIALARETSHAGYPLKACVALKIMGTLDSAVNEVFDLLAARYARGASIGRAVRLASPDTEALVPDTAYLSSDVSGATLLDAALRVATSREGLPPWPAVVPPIPLLSELPRDAFARVLRAAELRRCARGEVVLREGAPADGFFMVARGVVEITREAGAIVLARPGEGAVIGEMALLSNAPRMATATVTEDADLLFFGGAALAAASSELTVVAATLERFVHQRVLANLLATHPIFKPFDEVQRHALAAHFETLTCPTGTTVIQQGSVARGLFVVLSGEVRVSAHGEHGEHELARLGSTEVFGEIALLRNAPTTATVTATCETQLLMLDRALFERLVNAVPALRAYFESLAEHRWIETALTLSGGVDVDILI